MAFITWLGHSCFLLKIDNHSIIIDPWLSNPRSPRKEVNIESIELVVITHGHGDHLGEAADILKKNRKARAVAIFELANHLVEAEGIEEERVIGGNIGGPIKTGVGEIKVALTPANHSSPYGSPTGAVVIGEEAKVYHAGDTGIMSEMQLIGEIYKPDVALLPIGGHYTMDHVEAAYAVRMLKPKIAIPMHYGTFPLLYGDPFEFKRMVEKLSPETKVMILEPGVEVELNL